MYERVIEDEYSTTHHALPLPLLATRLGRQLLHVRRFPSLTAETLIVRFSTINHQPHGGSG